MGSYDIRIGFCVTFEDAISIFVADGEVARTKLVHKVSRVTVDPSFTEMIVKTDAFNSGAIRFCKRNEFVETMEVTEEIGKVRVPTRF